jgi:hypothetical protein
MTGATPPQTVEKAQAALREQARGVATSRLIKEVQRDGILHIVDNLKRQLLFSPGPALSGTGFRLGGGRRIISALHLIEDTPAVAKAISSHRPATARDETGTWSRPKPHDRGARQAAKQLCRKKKLAPWAF